MDQMLPSPSFSIPSIGMGHLYINLRKTNSYFLMLYNNSSNHRLQQFLRWRQWGGLTPTLGLGMGHAMTMPQTKYVTGFALPLNNMAVHTTVSA
ncbi:hypothetical protein NQ315_016598, partial [Exocentrus adspersus]